MIPIIEWVFFRVRLVFRGDKITGRNGDYIFTKKAVYQIFRKEKK